VAGVEAIGCLGSSVGLKPSAVSGLEVGVALVVGHDPGT
jgi:hypothetical protein